MRVGIQTTDVIQNAFAINVAIRSLEPQVEIQASYRAGLVSSRLCKCLASLCVSSSPPLVGPELVVTWPWLDFS